MKYRVEVTETWTNYHLVEAESDEEVEQMIEDGLPQPYDGTCHSSDVEFRELTPEQAADMERKL